MNDSHLEDEEAYRLRHVHAMKRMQSGVALAMNYPTESSETAPKHLRVGINSAHSDHAALVTTLLEAGVITRLAYYKNLAEFAEREADAYEQRIQDITGNPNVKLGPAGEIPGAKP